MAKEKKAAGRPTRFPGKGPVFGIKITDAAREMVEQSATAAGLTRSDFIEHLIRRFGLREGERLQKHGIKQAERLAARSLQVSARRRAKAAGQEAVGS